jgi:hypothetical protein
MRAWAACTASATCQYDSHRYYLAHSHVWIIEAARPSKFRPRFVKIKIIQDGLPGATCCIMYTLQVMSSNRCYALPCVFSARVLTHQCPG